MSNIIDDYAMRFGSDIIPHLENNTLQRRHNERDGIGV